MDKALQEALKDYNTVFNLMPMPKQAAREETATSTGKTIHEPYPTYGANKSKGKGKYHKDGKSLSSNAAPKGYAGCVGRDGKNRPICFDYNLGTYNKAPAGGACPKGRHVCFKAGCFKAHTFKEGHPDEQPTKE